MTTPVKSDTRISKSGPPPHSRSCFCGNVKGVQVHIGCIVGTNTMEPIFTTPQPCDESCKRWMRVDKGVVWLQSLMARAVLTNPMLGAFHGNSR